MRQKVVLALAGLCMLGSGAALAETRIFSVVADRAAHKLYIEGADFTSSMLSTDVPYVEFNGGRLAIDAGATTNNHLEATLPASVPDGEYSVFVSRVNRLLDPLTGALPIQNSAHTNLASLRALYSLTIATPLPGPQGIPGVQGPPGVSGVEIVTSAPSPVLGTTATPVTVTATCPAGKKVVGGGYFLAGKNRDRVLVIGSAAGSPTSWGATMSRAAGDTTSITANVFAQAICATAP